MVAAKRVIGFTGTEDGMTPAQRLAVSLALQVLAQEKKHFEFHHGMCEGADEQFDELVRQVVTVSTLIGHPGVLPTTGKPYRRSKTCKPDVVLPADTMLRRNENIAYAATELWATPKEKTEILRSGTWATIRYARKAGKTVRIFWWDGTETINHGR